MMKKLLIFVLCGIVSPSLCSLVKVRAFQEPLCRSDLIYRIDSGMRPEPFYKRDSIYQKESNSENEVSVPQRPQIVRNEPFYGMRLVPHIIIPQQSIIPFQRGVQSMITNEGEIQNENITPTEQIIRPESFIKREQIIPQVVQTPVPSTVQLLREGQNLKNNPEIYFPLSSCSRIHYRRHIMPKIKSMEQQNTFYSVQSQMPQHFQQIPPRIVYDNSVMNSQILHPVTAIPRIQQCVSQNAGASIENVQYSPGSNQNNQENSNLGNESLQFQNMANNFQNSPPVSEELQEEMGPAVTARAVSSMPNAIPLNQISSIC